MSRVNQILEGADFPVDPIVACMMATRIALVLEAMKHHATAGDSAKVAACAESGRKTVYTLVKELALRHGCNPEKTFEYWLGLAGPMVPLSTFEGSK
jgi:hypothetical protein